MSTLKVDLELVKKYNVAGPRYTSYPPATKFSDALGWDELSGHIEANNQSPRDLSIYFHIPFCETLCWFCGCTTVITLNHDKGRDYIDYLGREVARIAPRLNRERKAVQLHFGGGSPTFLRPDEIRRLGDIIHKHFTFSTDIEASVEVDPRRLTRDHLAALREIGFNRASMGVQDFNPQVQEAIHRIQPQAMTQQVLDWFPHTCGGDRVRRVVLEPRVGGQHYEDWGEDRGHLYGQVTVFDPPSRRATRGRLSPGTILDAEYELTEEPGAVRVRVTKVAAGPREATAFIAAVGFGQADPPGL